MMLKETTNYLKSRFPDKITVNVHFDKEKILVPLNQLLLHWAIENICKNAVDSMKGDGEISVSLTEENKNVLINISDNGEGMNRSIIKNIFKPGFTSKKRGWGLGLSLSKRIVEEYHKGSLYVMYSEKGIGTTFTIRLPKS